MPTTLKSQPRGQSFLHQNLLSLRLTRVAATGIATSSGTMAKNCPVTRAVGNHIEMDLRCTKPLLIIPMGQTQQNILILRAMVPTTADPKIPYARTPFLFDITLLTGHAGHNK